MKKIIAVLFLCGFLPLGALADTDFSLTGHKSVTTQNHLSLESPQVKEKTFVVEHPLNYKDMQFIYSVSKHVRFEHAEMYNSSHPEVRVNFEGGLAIGMYKNSLYYWSPYVMAQVARRGDASVSGMIAWYGQKSIPALVWKYGIFTSRDFRVELFAITDPLLISGKVVAGVSLSKHF
jgi:hypothetical protein